MKITCTLSEYTKMARLCGETKARFNCRNCPLNGLLELPEGEKCDIERFVQAVAMPESPLASTFSQAHNSTRPATEVPEGCIHATVPRARGESLETR